MLRCGQFIIILITVSLTFLVLDVGCSIANGPHQCLNSQRQIQTADHNAELGHGSDDAMSEKGTLDTGIHMVVSLLFVLALIFGGVFVLKRITPYKGFAGTEHPISIISKASLGQRKSICLVKIADEVLVVGVTNANISLLTKISAEDYYGEDKQAIYERSQEKNKLSFKNIFSKLIQLKGKSLIAR